MLGCELQVHGSLDKHKQYGAEDGKPYKEPFAKLV